MRMPENELERVVHRYWGLVVRIAARVLHDTTSAEDVAQDVFVALWRSGAPPAPGDHLRNWLCLAARNRATSLRRHAALRIDDAITPELLPAGKPEDRETWPDLFAGAVSRLPERYEEAVRLRYLVGMDVAHVAVALKIPKETARTRVRRGVERLKLQLAPQQPHSNTPPPQQKIKSTQG